MSIFGLPLSVTARAGTNIALVKYWGKRDETLNLPATGSLSLTLANFGSETMVRFAPDAESPDGGDRITLDGAPAPSRFAERVKRFLDLIRHEARVGLPAEVATRNSVPTAAGLASSAAGFAALALAASRAAGMNLAPPELSALARQGSGSAARSIFGGFVEMAPGTQRNGGDACAQALLPEDAWDVCLVVAITADGPKAIASSEAMQLTAKTSPYYAGWLQAVPEDLAAARAAVMAQDLARLGHVAERSAMRMHACAMAADPPILYWNAATLATMETVRRLRATGTNAFFTIDAGPHVKILCAARDAALVEPALAATPGVLRTLVLAPGPGAEVLREERR
ncbi:MAG TPA: diphosphomevalonate decarboxylase [Polyangia bacterium]|jgi:diphosphomevalonate decarboxylase|nr:diphosphomevalonate decarboxylase [Polyangia bacterium]